VTQRQRPPGRNAALAGRKRSRGGGGEGDGEESALVDAVFASTQKMSEQLVRSEAQRAERNDTLRRRVILFERELEVRKFELLLGPTSSATDHEKQTARTLLLNSLQNFAEKAQDNGAGPATQAISDGRCGRRRLSLAMSNDSDAEVAATLEVNEGQKTESIATRGSMLSH
jgi:hypothetical protein